MSTSSYMVVVAIDFGTTYSGYAFSFKNDPQKVQTNEKWSNLISQKTPTALLLNKDQKFDSFGFDAEQKYSDLLEDEDAEGWSLFRRFKMKLYDNDELSLKFELDDWANTIKMPAITIFSMSIKYLKDHALSVLNNPKRPDLHCKQSDVFFVLTVPAIWDDRAKMFMREAAVEAGIPRHQIGMALESEAASVWCQSIKDKYAIANTGSKYMVIDIGGGTADITVHEKLTDGKLRELIPATGGDWGGTKVDKSFFGMLKDILGKGTMKRFNKECLSDVFDLLKEFEMVKRSVSADSSTQIKIRLPAKLQEIKREHMSQTKMRRELEEGINGSKYAGKISLKQDKLRIDPDIAREMFSESIASLCDEVECVFDSQDMNDVKTVLVVGGFSESPLMQQKLKQSLAGKRMVFPADPGVVVLKGAVLYGHQPDMIACRIARFTYGLKITTAFSSEDHESRYKTGNSVDLFQMYVRKGTEISAGYKVSERQTPSDRDIMGGYASFSMYISTQVSPKYVNEPSCKLLGKLEVPMPDGENKGYETSFIFGSTEIMLVVKHLNSGELSSRYFNF